MINKMSDVNDKLLNIILQYINIVKQNQGNGYAY